MTWYPVVFFPSGAVSRETKVQVVQLEFGDYFIISSLSTRANTQIISIDSTTEILQYQGRNDLDLFSSKQDAKQYLSTANCMIRNSLHAQAIIGYATVGSVRLLLVATKLKVSPLVLLCRDVIYTILESQWIKILLRNP